MTPRLAVTRLNSGEVKPVFFVDKSLMSGDLGTSKLDRMGHCHASQGTYRAEPLDGPVCADPKWPPHPWFHWSRPSLDRLQGPGPRDAPPTPGPPQEAAPSPSTEQTLPPPPAPAPVTTGRALPAQGPPSSSPVDTRPQLTGLFLCYTSRATPRIPDRLSRVTPSPATDARLRT